jgi:predicted DNA-binding transcriptional regulator YafY
MMAECIYAARFLDEKTAKRLVDVVCEQVSDNDAKRIKHNVFLTDRVKTDCTSVYVNVSIINDAMSKEIDGEKHIPEKIKFKYLKSTIQNVKNKVERRHGDEYVVSPYQLLINDGNYYLLGLDDKSMKVRTFRVDRMKNVKFTNIARKGEEEFAKINISSYAKEHFGMFSGNREHVTLRFIEPLLDTVVDRFGSKDVVYMKDDDRHFKAVVPVAISDQFFGWLCGFGKRVKILAPESVKEKFKIHLDKMRSMYE